MNALDFDENRKSLAKFFSGQLYVAIGILLLWLLDHTKYPIPNAPGVLAVIVVYSAFNAGFYSGLLTALLAWAYTAIHFSVPGSLFHFSQADLTRMIIWALIYPAQAWMTGRLKSRLLSQAQKEKELREKVVAASKMSSLGEMAGGIAHEINNPLAIIKLSAGQIQDLIGEEIINKSKIAEFAKNVENAADRAAKIISGLITFSRDGGADPFKELSTSLLIENTLSYCGHRFKSGEIKLMIVGNDKPLSVFGVESEIAQVLLNLLNNACDGVSSESEKWIKISVLEREKMVEIHVTDSGKGIPPNLREKVFQPFFTTKEIGKGTGLGLSISLGIVRRHFGELYVDGSNPNSCLVLRIPKFNVGEKAQLLQRNPAA
jgi:C4-dicarboxylate-specific signal transduction histidine kinase